MRRPRFGDAVCPAARALDEIGDWWTLVTVRDALHGARRRMARAALVDNRWEILVVNPLKRPAVSTRRGLRHGSTRPRHSGSR